MIRNIVGVTGWMGLYNADYDLYSTVIPLTLWPEVMPLIELLPETSQLEKKRQSRHVMIFGNSGRRAA